MVDQSKKRVPPGKPLRLTDEQLEELAQVTPADIEKAKAFWKNNVSEKFKTLLDAPRVDDEQGNNASPNQ